MPQKAQTKGQGWERVSFWDTDLSDMNARSQVFTIGEMFKAHF